MATIFGDVQYIPKSYTIIVHYTIGYMATNGYYMIKYTQVMGHLTTPSMAHLSLLAQAAVPGSSLPSSQSQKSSFTAEAASWVDLTRGRRWRFPREIPDVQHGKFQGFKR